MEIFGIGIDVVEIARIDRAIEAHQDRFLKKIFTSQEREYCKDRRSSALHFAARFAAKEAAAKALKTGIGGDAGWLDLEVINGPSGAPEIRLHGNAAAFAKRHGITQILVSLSHSKDYAAANALAICQ
ncbi:MAG: holo-[acyl-carrier-protein] synthase [Verrucomicrobia bacterium]|nr:MAG: holo-[acyl-carrier-protein] synthase [Verrucomicrobiota bacterium]